MSLLPWVEHPAEPSFARRVNWNGKMYELDREECFNTETGVEVTGRLNEAIYASTETDEAYHYWQPTHHYTFVAQRGMHGLPCEDFDHEWKQLIDWAEYMILTDNERLVLAIQAEEACST